MPHKRHSLIYLVILILILLLFTGDMMIGSVDISPKEVWLALFDAGSDEVNGRIIRNIRLMKALVAILVGLALPVCGLQMQTLFRNPLAGPYTLGVSAGASLGVALFMLGAPLTGMVGSSALSVIGVAGAAWLGSAMLLLILTATSHRIKDIMVILILGMMFSAGISAVVQVMQYFSEESRLKSFVIWTMGSLGDVTLEQMQLMLPAIIVGLLLSVRSIKALNLLLLGEQYAKSMGVNIQQSRRLIFLSTTLLAGTVTAFCGPIGFIGLAVPHLARALFHHADHRVLMLGSSLMGVAIMLLCDITAKCLALPINTITALVGIPIVIWVVIRNKSIA